MMQTTHKVLTDSEASSCRVKSVILLSLLLPYSAGALYATPKIVDYTGSAILGNTGSAIFGGVLLIGWLFSAVLYLLKISFPGDYAELSADDYKKFSENLTEVPHLQPVFKEAIKAGKAIRYRDLQFLSSVYEPLRAKKLKTSAEQDILHAK
jgi:hypothetical protein